jgi:hypothetical protein
MDETDVAAVEFAEFEWEWLPLEEMELPDPFDPLSDCCRAKLSKDAFLVCERAL